MRWSIPAAALLALAALPPASADDARTHEEITRAVERALRAAPSLDEGRLDVRTRDGVVTLSGTVRHLLARDRAVEIALDLKGVRSVVDRIELRVPDREDADVLRDVRRALRYDPATATLALDIAVEDGRVRLSGTVDSRAVRAQAARTVRGVLGVRGIENRIALAGAPARTDDEIRRDIRFGFQARTWLGAQLVDVGVEDGRVTLAGEIGSALERRRAIAVARFVPGVRDVDAEGLTVSWLERDRMRETDSWADVRDPRLKDALEYALLHDPRVKAYRPEVRVDDGVVTLLGSVGTLQAKRAAEEDARNTLGVWRVENHLRVRPETDVPDEEAQAQVAAALARDPYLHRFDFTVDVLNGHAYLYGRVDTAFERAQAERVAERARGVVAVRNRVEVRPGARPRSDERLAEELRDWIGWSPHVDLEGLDVTVRGGVVRLEGTVETWELRSRVADRAYALGATRVLNDLEARFGGPRGDYGPRD